MSVEAMLEGAARENEAWRKRAVAKVIAWRAFCKQEKQLYTAFMAGNATRDQWSKCWATAPPEPTRREYEVAWENGK